MSARKFRVLPFLKNEQGHVAITFGLISTIAVAAVGGAVDFGRTVNMKSRMQNALDSAVIAGLTKYKDSQNWTQAKATAEATFKGIFTAALTQSQVAGSEGSPGVSPSLEQPVVSFVEANGSLTASATTTMNTPFMHLLTGSNMQLTSQSGGSLSGSTTNTTAGTKVEVSMMIDLTGSMGWSDQGYGTKIAALKAAGQDILDILLPTSGVNNDKVRIAVAPFADYVNAGPYAATVTGLASTGGAYSNISNLASTKNGSFTGSYSGATGSSDPAGATSSGSTYNNGYCANPTTTTNATIATNSGYRTGVYVESSGSADIAGLIRVSQYASYSDYFRAIYSADGDGSTQIQYYSGTYSGYFVPRVESSAGLTRRTYSTYSGGRTYSGDLGAAVTAESGYSTSGMQALGFVRATSNNGYWRVTKVNSNGSMSISWTTSGWYLPIYESLSNTTTVAGCESGSQSQPTSKLISCVTERSTFSTRYTDDVANSSNGYVGAYNAGSSSKSNYSSDGKCYTAGRELASIIPLTNERSTLSTFFNTATVGGATPGHLGTAWAWYMLSPNWSSVFTGAVPADYTDSTTKKYAILMTDGEYNIYYANSTSAMNQALNLCTNMKAKNITVFTVGFGLGQNVTAKSDGTAAQRAKYVLEQCATSSGHHFFPYNGDALRTAFQNIGNQITGEATTVIVNGARLTQ